METVLFLLKRRSWQQTCLRANIAPPEKIKLWKTVKVAHVESNLCGTKTTLDRLLRDAIEEIAPEWWGDETNIILNRNVTCEKHRDGNEGHSWILWLGDFTGGGARL